VDDDGTLSYTIDAPTSDSTLVTINGELDLSNVERLETAVLPALKARPRQLVLDLRGLRFADSSAITLWVKWAKQVGELKLRNVSPLLRRVIEMMGLAEKLSLDP